MTNLRGLCPVAAQTRDAGYLTRLLATIAAGRRLQGHGGVDRAGVYKVAKQGAVPDGVRCF